MSLIMLFLLCTLIYPFFLIAIVNCIIKIFNLIIKPNIIEISETRLQNEKEPMTYIFVPSYVYEHTSTESGKGKTFVYTDK